MCVAVLIAVHFVAMKQKKRMKKKIYIKLLRTVNTRASAVIENEEHVRPQSAV
jgi:hypothetical protein